MDRVIKNERELVSVNQGIHEFYTNVGGAFEMMAYHLCVCVCVCVCICVKL